MVRKNIVLAVATPRRFQGTLVWTADDERRVGEAEPTP